MRDVADCQRIGRGTGGVRDRGLEAAEAEVQPRPVGHGAREMEPAGPAAFRHPAGIAEPEELGGLVEGLAHGVVQRFAEDVVLAHAAHRGEQRVPARHQQGGERKPGRVRLEHRREQVAFHMMDADRRHVPGQRQAPPDGRAHEQRPGQARAGGVGHPAHLLRPGRGLVHDQLEQRQGLADVIAGRQLRHHPAVGGVQIHLRIKPMRQQAPVRVEQGHAGVVAGGLQPEDAHTVDFTGLTERIPLSRKREREASRSALSRGLVHSGRGEVRASIPVGMRVRDGEGDGWGGFGYTKPAGIYKIAPFPWLDP